MKRAEKTQGKSKSAVVMQGAIRGAIGWRQVLGEATDKPSVLPVMGVSTASTLAAWGADAHAAPIAFTNIATDAAMNLNFERARSDGYASLQAFYGESVNNPVPLEAVFAGTPTARAAFPGWR